MFCMLIFYISGGTYSLKPTLNDRFFEKLFMAILFILRVFVTNFLRGNRRRNTFRILFSCLTRSSYPSFSSNKPTHYLLGHDDSSQIICVVPHLTSATLMDCGPTSLVAWALLQKQALVSSVHPNEINNTVRNVARQLQGKSPHTRKRWIQSLRDLLLRRDEKRREEKRRQEKRREEKRREEKRREGMRDEFSYVTPRVFPICFCGIIIIVYHQKKNIKIRACFLASLIFK